MTWQPSVHDIDTPALVVFNGLRLLRNKEPS